MISVLILTYNEEANLSQCLESVQWSDDVVVFDSFSTDRTVEIARAYGARVYQRTFDNYGAQREAARQVGYKNSWVLALDADERPDEHVVQEMLEIAQSPTTTTAYRMRRKDHFMGRWIRHSTLYPSWFVRFYRPDQIRYEPRAVHEYPTVSGLVGELEGHLLHYSFNKGLEDWLLKHVHYSRLEASENLRSLKDNSVDFAGLFSVSNPVRRRQALKALSMRLPFRPLLRFIYMYVIRGGFLDGWQGMQYCRMLSMYEQMIVYQLRDLRFTTVPSNSADQQTSDSSRRAA